MSDRRDLARRADQLWLENPGKTYAPMPAAWYGWGSHVLDGTPWFTYWDIPRMTRDPQVRFVLDMLRSPYQQVKFKVKANRQDVADFALDTIKRFWHRAVPQILHAYHRWGFAPGLLRYTQGPKGVRFAKFQRVEPRDAAPVVWKEGPKQGDFAGFRLNPGGGFGLPVEINNAEGLITTPHAFWFAGSQTFGKLYDEPPLAGAFTPWLTKVGRGGGEHSARLWYMKNAFGGGVLRHPEGVTNIGTADDPRYVNAQDLARETLENVQNGSGITLPNTVGPNGSSPAWDYTPPTVYGDPRGLLDYCDRLDKQITKGLGFPPEVLEASEVGSGWAGRMVPAQAFLGSCDERVMQLVGSAEDCFLRALVAQRFGPKARYEIHPVPLVESVFDKQGQQPGAGAAPQPGGAQPPTGGGAPGPDAALDKLFAGAGKGSSKVPYTGPRGGHGVKDPTTGRVRYGGSLSQLNAGDDVALARKYAAKVLRKLK